MENSFLKSLIIDILVALALAGAILFFIRPTIVKQTSMQDTLQPNDYIIMYKRAYVSDTPERGDIVIFKSNLTDEKGKNKLLIKRIIGLPGDEVTIKGNQLYLNGSKYEEDYIRDGVTPGDVEGYIVPEGKYFTMGDNRIVSIDSRYDEVGCVSVDEIQGKAVLRLFPFSRIGRL
ncbi:MAG: signal peptidase I [Firmicutes bacterium]|nr:signal peptidase I [Bacillota bacterium]